jgi:sRNA-binding protein
MSAGKKRQRSIDAQKQIDVLRERWPAAFPAKARDVKPLEFGVASKIAAAMGWSNRYAWQVVARWKSWKVYCRAVLWTATRITLEGAPAQPVDDKARELARERLAKLAARALARQALPADEKTRPQSVPDRPAGNREAARDKRKTASSTPLRKTSLAPSPCEKSPTAKPVASRTPAPERLGIAGLSRFAPGHLNDSTQASCSPTLPPREISPTNPASQPERLGIAGLKAAAQQRRAAAAGG